MFVTCLGWIGLVVLQFASSGSLKLKLNERFAMCFSMHIYLYTIIDKYNIRCDICIEHVKTFKR